MTKIKNLKFFGQKRLFLKFLPELALFAKWTGPRDSEFWSPRTRFGHPVFSEPEIREETGASRTTILACVRKRPKCSESPLLALLFKIAIFGRNFEITIRVDFPAAKFSNFRARSDSTGQNSGRARDEFRIPWKFVWEIANEVTFLATKIAPFRKSWVFGILATFRFWPCLINEGFGPKYQVFEFLCTGFSRPRKNWKTAKTAKTAKSEFRALAGKISVLQNFWASLEATLHEISESAKMDQNGENGRFCKNWNFRPENTNLH